MESIPFEVWLLAAAIGGAVVVSTLHALTSRARYEIDCYDLRVKTRKLRHDYDERLRMLQKVRDVEALDLTEVGKSSVDDVITESDIEQSGVKAAA